MNSQKKVKQENISTEVLGKCPNCSQTLYEDACVSIPIKDQELTALGTFQESLVVCNECSDNPERLSSEKVGESLRGLKVKWEEDYIAHAMLAVDLYKSLKLVQKNQDEDHSLES